MTAEYQTLEDIWLDVIDGFRPPERLSISEAAERYVYLDNPGQFTGHYSIRQAPYMAEPAECLRSRLLSSTVFVGSAQCGKTQALILNWIAYSAKMDGMDMLVFSPTQAGARDFSIRRVDRMHRDSPQIGRMLLANKDADNVFDKQYRSGCLLGLAWPTVAQLAGRPVGRIALTDYDRFEDNIGKEGGAFDLAQNRTRTFGSFAMTVAESSPSRDIEDSRWVPTSLHEAPPTKGIFSLYNRGDRRRWYWPCPHCNAWFMGRWEDLQWDEKGSVLERGESARMICPTNGCVIMPTHRSEMNEDGMWLRDGQTIDPMTHAILGTGTRSRTASFWLEGVASAFQPWSELVVNFINASNELDRTTSEDSLRKFWNTDLARAYMPLALQSLLSPVELMGRGEYFPSTEQEDGERINRRPEVEPLVPEGVRFLVATVDVQGRMFVVQVHGIIPGETKGVYDLLVLDRFQLRMSRRTVHGDQFEWVEPAAYLEDWNEIMTEVMDRTYALDEPEPRRRMGIKLVGCDSGGKKGTTTNAYNFYRRLRAEGRAHQFQLLRGSPTLTIQRAHITFPDSSRKDKLSGTRGDVPVMALNSNQLKDLAFGRLSVMIEGKGKVRFPKWFHEAFFNELCVETRTDKGWENPRKLRNEAWDLLYYCFGMLVSNRIRIENMDWANPPDWAAPWDSNTLVSTVETVSRFKPMAQEQMADFRDFGRLMAGR